MSSDPLKNHTTSKDQEPLDIVYTPIEKARLAKFGTTSYKPEYADACYKMLSSSSGAKTKSHCCALLQCSKATLLKWMRKFPEFHAAITDGLEIGKAKWRNKIQRHAYKPSKDVNNGLIKLLSANVYGIKDDSEAPNIILNNQNDIDPEKLMKMRGIPIPTIENGDIDE